jgi:peptidoglycan/xylan/chitin deacetylase (PgdA/CDA1 family)
MVRAYPWMVRRVYDEGHTVANHTQNHPIRKMSVDQAAREIEEGFASLREAIGDPQAVSPLSFGYRVCCARSRSSSTSRPMGI